MRQWRLLTNIKLINFSTLFPCLLRNRTIQVGLAYPYITLKEISEVSIQFCSCPAETTNKPVSHVSSHYHNQVRRKSYQIIYICQAFNNPGVPTHSILCPEGKIMKTNPSISSVLSSTVSSKLYSYFAFYPTPPHPL